MAKRCKIVLCGVGGYGRIYANALVGRDDIDIVGYIDPRPEGFDKLDQLNARSKRYESLEAFYESGGKADLCVISSPIPFHLPQSRTALRGGSHVLCEKPASSTPQDIRKMDEARKESGLYLDIGFQWSHDASILKLKEIIASGKLGKSKRLRSMTLWPRNARYYGRAKWPGKVRGDDGGFILDSVASNATAHYLHNMYFVLGGAPDNTACPVSLQAELYRVNPVETFDTVMSRSMMADGTEVLFYASHAVRDNIENSPFIYEFENGTAVFPASEDNSVIEIRYNDGMVETLGSPFKQNTRKLDWMIKLAIGEEAPPPPMPPLAALPLTLSVCAMHRSKPQAKFFPKEITHLHNEDYLYVDGLAEIIKECYARGVLPGELGASWAKPGQTVAITPDDDFVDPGIR